MEHIGVIEMLSKLSNLCYAAASHGDRDDLLTLYRNGPSDAVYAFNKTIDYYVEVMNTKLDETNGLIFILLVSILAAITAFMLFIAVPIFLNLNRMRKVYWSEMIALIKGCGFSLRG
ncbi:MAG: hypothetical protein V2I33_22325 [Kangiellaceae bacterium]|jgi:hypothetical protein|nr:hypothetical protein [Kangiellaceae bacterium]